MKFNKKRISIALACMIAFGNINFPYAIENIDNHWAKHSLQAFLEKGYIKGDQNGNIHPNKKITRAEFVSIVNNALSYTKPSDKINSYSDVKKDDWYYNPFSIALAEGYISGTGTDKLSPKSSLTRQEAMKIIDNIVSKNCDFDLSVVKDEKKIPSWAKQATKNMIAQGYIAGYEGNINPGAPMTKAEAISFLNAYVNNDRTISFEGTYSLGEVNTLRVLSNGVTIKDSSIKKLIIDKNLDGKLNLQNVTIEMMQNESKKISVIQDEQQQYADGVYEGTANGYSGEIKVQVTIEKGKISKIDILSQKEELIYFNSAKKVIDRILEKQTPQVDASTGATISSKGIMYAVQDALSKAEKKTETKVSEYKDGTYIGEANGFSDTVKVEVVIAGGKITDTKLLSHSDDDSYMNSAVNLLQDVKSKQTADNIDGISGATYSSDGILNAVRDALSQAKGLTKATGQSEYAFKNLGGGNAGGSGHAGAKKEKDFSFLKNGTYEGYASGYRPNSMGVRVTVAGRKISKIDVIRNNDDKGYLTEEGIKTLEKRIIEKQSTRVDVISKATASSKGYINAVVNALEKAYSKDSTMADRYEQDIEELIIGQSEKLSEYRLRAALKSLAPTTTITMLNKIDTKVIGNYPLNIKLDFSDKSTKTIKITIKVQEKANNHLFLSLDELKELDKKTVYIDGVYYGDAYGYVKQKPIPLKVTITDKRIVDIEKVKEEMTSVGENEKIDDGDIFESKLFDLISKIKASHAPQEIIYTITRVNEITDEVLSSADFTIEEVKKNPEDVVQKIRDALDAVIGKHEFGSGRKTITVENLKSSGLSHMSDVKTIVRSLIKDYVKEELGYSVEEFDTISGATFSGTGGAEAIKNAFVKMQQKDIIDMRVVHDSYKRDYVLGNKLDISNLKVRLYYKDNKEEVVEYKDFSKHSLEVFNFDNSAKPVYNDMLLIKDNLAGYQGLVMGIKHTPTNTVKRTKTILIKSPFIELEDVKLQIRKDNSTVYNTIGIKSNDREFVKNIYIQKDEFNQVSNLNNPQFIRIAKDKDGNEKVFSIQSKIWYNGGKKNYDVEIKPDELKNKENENITEEKDKKPDYSIKHANLRLNIHPYEYEVDPEKSFADNYFAHKKFEDPIVVEVNSTVSDKEVKKLFANIFLNTKIQIINQPDTKTTGNTKMLVKLTFEDESEKEIEIPIKVSGSLQSSIYKKYIDEHGTKTVRYMTFPEKYKNITVLKEYIEAENRKAEKEITDISLFYNKANIKKEHKAKSVTILQRPNLNDVTKDATTKVEIKFEDGSTLIVPLKSEIRPVYVDVAEVKTDDMKKTYPIGLTIDDLDKIKVIAKLENTDKNIGEVPYEDFKYFNLTVKTADGKAMTGDTIIEDDFVKDGKIKARVYYGDGNNYKEILDLVATEKKENKADIFGHKYPKLNKLYTIVVPASDLKEKGKISTINKATKLDGEDKYEREEHKKAKYLRYSLDLNKKEEELKLGPIKVKLNTEVDYSTIGDSTVEIELTFDDGSRKTYTTDLTVRPIPIAKYNSQYLYKQKNYKLQENPNINFDDLNLWVYPYADQGKYDNIGNPIMILQKSGEKIENIRFDDLKYFGLQIVDKNNNPVENNRALKSFTDISGDLGLKIKYTVEQGTFDSGQDYNLSKNPALENPDYTEKPLKLYAIE